MPNEEKLWDDLGTPLYPHMPCPVCDDASEVGSHFDAAWCCNCGTLSGGLTKMRADARKRMADEAAKHGLRLIGPAEAAVLDAMAKVPDVAVGPNGSSPGPAWEPVRQAEFEKRWPELARRQQTPEKERE